MVIGYLTYKFKPSLMRYYYLDALILFGIESYILIKLINDLICLELDNNWIEQSSFLGKLVDYRTFPRFPFLSNDGHYSNDMPV